MFCSTCGKEINDKAVVCVGCGVPTTNSQNVNFVQPIPVMNGVQPNNQVPPWNGGIVFLWFLLTAFAPLFGWIMGGINVKYDSRRGVSIGLIFFGILTSVINFAILLSA